MGLGATLAQPIKLAIASDLTLGLKPEELANKYDTSIRSIQRIKTQLHQSAIVPALHADWRDTGNGKALDATFAGLDCRKDPYKRAGLGIQWLKGTGLLLPDNTTQINNLFASMPADWADEFAPAPIDIPATEVLGDTTTSSDSDPQ